MQIPVGLNKAIDIWYKTGSGKDLVNIHGLFQMGHAQNSELLCDAESFIYKQMT